MCESELELVGGREGERERGREGERESARQGVTGSGGEAEGVCALEREARGQKDNSVSDGGLLLTTPPGNMP